MAKSSRSWGYPQVHRRTDRGDINRPQRRRSPVGNHESRGRVRRERRIHKTSSTELAQRVGAKPRERKTRRRLQPIMKSRETDWALSRSIIHYLLLRLLEFPDLMPPGRTPPDTPFFESAGAPSA